MQRERSADGPVRESTPDCTPLRSPDGRPTFRLGAHGPGLICSSCMLLSVFLAGRGRNRWRAQIRPSKPDPAIWACCSIILRAQRRWNMTGPEIAPADNAAASRSAAVRGGALLLIAALLLLLSVVGYWDGIGLPEVVSDFRPYYLGAALLLGAAMLLGGRRPVRRHRWAALGFLVVVAINAWEIVPVAFGIARPASPGALQSRWPPSMSSGATLGSQRCGPGQPTSCRTW